MKFLFLFKTPVAEHAAGHPKFSGYLELPFPVEIPGYENSDRCLWFVQLCLQEGPPASSAMDKNAASSKPAPAPAENKWRKGLLSHGQTYSPDEHVPD